MYFVVGLGLSIALSFTCQNLAKAQAGGTLERSTPISGFMEHSQKGLKFRGMFFEIGSKGDRHDKGWNSLRRDGVEFFHEGGAFSFRASDGREVARFPDATNMSHDSQSGRMGGVSDGIHLVRLTPSETTAECRLYAGSNVDGKVTVTIYPAPGATAVEQKDGSVLLEAQGHPLRLGRPTINPGTPQEIPGAALRVLDREHPSGGRTTAVEWDIEGFKGNEILISYDAPEWTPPPVSKVAFDVKSSADPGITAGGKRPLGPINGVTNPLYGPGIDVDFGMVLSWSGEEPFEGFAELEIINSLGGVDFYQKLPVGPVAPNTKDFRVKFAPEFSRPGVMDVWGRLSDKAGNLLWVGRYRAAYDWENFRPTIQVEPDFREFWENTLAELRSIPLEPRVERVREYEDAPDFEIYRVSFLSWNRERIHAMLFVPREGTRPFPAIVTAHPGTKGFGINKNADGVYGSKIKQDPRFVTIVPLIRGHEPDAQDIPFNHPWWGPLGDRDTYVARAWYCALVRALDYLATRPDLVDMKRVVAKGGSQGGAFALVTAALDPRISVCIADCPANCQPHEIMENYPSFGPSIGQVPEGKTIEEAQRALSYYNPVNFAPLIKCPTYVGSNIGDVTVHSLGPLAAYHNLTGLQPDQKAFHPGFTHFHGSGPGLGAKTREVLDRLSSGQ